MSKYLLLIFALNVSIITFAQDVIVKTNRDSIFSKILEVGIDEIKYKWHDNLEGPLFIITKNEVSEIVFANGSKVTFVEAINSENYGLEETKALITEYINKYSYSHKGKYKYGAIFEDKYLKISPHTRGELYSTELATYYDFSGECTFQELSDRYQGISYINVFVKVFTKKNNGDFRKKKGTKKLVLNIKGHENAKVLRDALIRYNEFFINTK